MVKTQDGTNCAVPFLTNDELRIALLQMEGQQAYDKNELPEEYWYLVSELSVRYEHAIKLWPLDPVMASIRDKMKGAQVRTDETLLMRAALVRIDQMA